MDDFQNQQWLNSIGQLVFIMETEFVLSELRIEFRNTSEINLGLQSINPCYEILSWA
jgi:hypothetical protein